MSKADIEALTAKWRDGWNIEDRAFDPSVFPNLFAPGENAISVFDNVQGDVLVIRSAEAYAATWGPFMAPMTYWAVRMDDLSIDVLGDLAVSTFKLVGTDCRGAEGQAIPFGQYGTHVWKRLDGVGWRIVHEHLTMYDRTREMGAKR